MKLNERFWFWLAYRLPRKLAYFAAVRIGDNATCGQYSNQVVSELTFMDALERWKP